MGDPRGTDPNLDGVSSISETPSYTTAMRGWGCTWLNLLPDAIIYGSGSGPVYALYSADLRPSLPAVLGFCTTSSLTGSGWIPCVLGLCHLWKPLVQAGGGGVEQPADPAVNNVRSGTGWQLRDCRILYQPHNCRTKLSGWHFLHPVISTHNRLNRLQLSHTYVATSMFIITWNSNFQ